MRLLTPTAADSATTGVKLYVRDGCAIPTNDGLTCVIVGCPVTRSHAPAQGITGAFRDAALLAAAIDAGFPGRQHLSRALAGYQQLPNEASLPMYELSCLPVVLGSPPPQAQRIFLELHGRIAGSRFLGILAGTIPVAELFGPEEPELAAGASAARGVRAYLKIDGRDGGGPKRARSPTGHPRR